MWQLGYEHWMGGGGPEVGFLLWGNDPGWYLPWEYKSWLVLLVAAEEISKQTTKLY